MIFALFHRVGTSTIKTSLLATSFSSGFSTATASGKSLRCARNERIVETKIAAVIERIRRDALP